MPGLDNDIRVDQLLRRAGVKGSSSVWPIVPGLFPTINAGDFKFLAARPRESIGWIGVREWVAAAAQTRGIRISAPADFVVRRLILNSSSRDVFEISRSRAGVSQIAVLTPVELGDQAIAGQAEQINAVGTTGTPLYDGDEGIIAQLDWYLGKNDTFEVTYLPSATNRYVHIGVEWSEVPVPSIEP